MNETVEDFIKKNAISRCTRPKIVLMNKNTTVYELDCYVNKDKANMSWTVFNKTTIDIKIKKNNSIMTYYPLQDEFIKA